MLNDGKQYQHNFTNNYVSDASLQKPSAAVAQAISEYTSRELEKSVGQLSLVSRTSSGKQIKLAETTKYIKYTPISQGATGQEAPQRLVRIDEMQIDPLAPPQFKHKRIPRGAGSPFVTVMRSPQHKLTLKDQLSMKIPPCVSNFKNPKGYTIPLEMRLAADGRTLKQHTVNEKFARFSDALEITERQGRKEIQERAIIDNTLKFKENKRREEEGRKIAQVTREEKMRIIEGQMSGARKPKGEGLINDEDVDDGEKEVRDRIKRLREKEVVRDYRIEQAGLKRGKNHKEENRDISEKVALGQAQPTAVSGESLYDQRLFNQSSGMDQGMHDDEEYNLYSKPLFQDRSALNIYGYRKEEGDDEEEGEEKDLSKMMRSKRADVSKGGRGKPVEFERHDDSMFGMDNFVDKAEKKVHK